MPGSIINKAMVTFLFTILVSSSQGASLACDQVHQVKSISTPVFDKGHNKPLVQVMKKIKKNDMEIREFVEGLSFNPKEFRDLQKLEQILLVAESYQHSFAYLIQHASDTMMTPRIEIVSDPKKAAFLKAYQQAYIDYLSALKALTAELMSYRTIPPENWNPKAASDILMHMNTLMGKSHNRY